MNEIKLTGIVDDILFYREVLGENFFVIILKSYRKSKTVDIIRCVVPIRFFEKMKIGEKIGIYGKIRTINYKKHLEIYVYAEKIFQTTDCSTNSVCLKGVLCKETIYRKTPLGRKITDFMLAVSNKENFKNNYIPCILWGNNALRASCLEIGTRLKIQGRLQSRNYQKKYSDGTCEIRTAYEVSANDYCILKGEQHVF